MQTGTGFGSDGDVSDLAVLAARADGIAASRREVEIREIRMLAEAGQLAVRQSAGAALKVKAHDMALRSISAELALILGIGERAVQMRIGHARDVVENYPATLVAWEAGAIESGHVRAITRAGMNVPFEKLPEFEDAAVGICETDTPGRVTSRLEVLAQRVHPRSFTERHQDAAASRRVRVYPTTDGMSEVVAVMPTVIAEGIYDRLTRQAEEIIDARPTYTASAEARDGAEADASRDGDGRDGDGNGNGRDGDGDGNGRDGDGSSFVDDARTKDQVRADVFADLLLAGAPMVDPTRGVDGDGALGKIRATVQVVVSALSLAGQDHGPADLVGHAPIDAETARRLAGNTGIWDRLLTHPVTGTVLCVDQYRPTSAMRRLLKARDQHCRFPGCRQPAIRCEIDHSIDYALGGPTDVCNLANLCQRHHSTKQFTRWNVVQLAGGILVWTSPTGRVYREDALRPAVSFFPEIPPPDTGPPPGSCRGASPGAPPHAASDSRPPF